MHHGTRPMGRNFSESGKPKRIRRRSRSCEQQLRDLFDKQHKPVQQSRIPWELVFSMRRPAGNILRSIGRCRLRLVIFGQLFEAFAYGVWTAEGGPPFIIIYGRGSAPSRPRPPPKKDPNDPAGNPKPCRPSNLTERMRVLGKTGGPDVEGFGPGEGRGPSRAS